MTWLDELEASWNTVDMDPLESTHITSAGYEHMANLTEKIDGGRARCIAMLPKEWSDYIAAVDTGFPRLLAIARAAERLTAALDIGRGYKIERDALRAALAGDGK